VSTDAVIIRWVFLRGKLPGGVGILDFPWQAESCRSKIIGGRIVVVVASTRQRWKMAMPYHTERGDSV